MSLDKSEQSPPSIEELSRRIEMLENITINFVPLKDLMSLKIHESGWEIKKRSNSRRVKPNA